MRFRVVLPLLLLTVLVSPVGGSVDDLIPSRVDPFHGSWKLVRSRMWDASEIECLFGQVDHHLRFDKHRVVYTREEAPNPVNESFFRLGNPRNCTGGQIDISLPGGGNRLLARYRFSPDRLFLCYTATDRSVRPNWCGPGANHILCEYVPYQPDCLVQSHLVQTATAKSTR